MVKIDEPHFLQSGDKVRVQSKTLVKGVYVETIGDNGEPSGGLAVGYAGRCTMPARVGGIVGQRDR